MDKKNLNDRTGFYAGVFLIGVLHFANLFSTRQVKASDLQPYQLPVTIKNVSGQCILIRDGGIYSTSEKLLLEIPMEIMPVEEVISIRIEGKEKKEKELFIYEFRVMRINDEDDSK